ncbi:MAG: ABC transporter substrate-binding protein [Clostridia bacterium]
MRKKTIVLLLSVTLFLSFSVSCGGKNRVVNYEDSEGEITTITFFGNKYEPENVRVIEQILSGFMKDNPDIRVSYESLKGNAYYDALEKRMASGKGNDVFMVNHDILLELQARGQVADLSDLKTIPDYTDRMRGQMYEDGKIFWLPTTVSIFGLYCNMDLLKKHRQDIPETLGEWEEICNYFTEQGITPIIANNDISLKTLAIGRGFYSLYQEDRQGEVFRRINSAEEKLSGYLRDGFSIVEQWIDKGFIDAEKALQTQKTSDDLEEFAKGEAPFLLTGVWASVRLENKNPDFAYEIAPLPILEDGPLLVVNADTRLSINADSAHPEAARRFVEYFTRADNIQKFSEQQSSFSPLRNGTLSSAEGIRRLVPCYESGRYVIGTDTLLDLPIWELTGQASRKLLSGESLQSVLDWMDQQAEEERLSR